MRKLVCTTITALCLLGALNATDAANNGETRYQVVYSPYWFYAYGGMGWTDMQARSHIVTDAEAPVFAKFVAKIHHNLEDELPACPAFTHEQVRITTPGTIINIHLAGVIQINATCYKFARWKIRHMEPFLNYLTSGKR